MAINMISESVSVSVTATGKVLSVDRKWSVSSEPAIDMETAYGCIDDSIVGESVYAFDGLDAICSSKSISLVADSAGKVHEVSVSYSSSEQASDDEDFLAYSATIGGQFVDVWRDGVAPNGGTPSDNDIGGTPIDNKGEPVSVMVLQSTIGKTRRYGTVPWDAIWAAIGKRNSATYEGAVAGRLLFKGVSITTVALGVYEVVYELVSDSHFHLRQVAERESDLKVKLNVDGYADVVTTIQPFPDQTAFSALIDG